VAGRPPRTGLLDRLRGRGLRRFEAGDLPGILPGGSRLARLYSLASGSRDGFVEICVRKHPHGPCSGPLFEIEIGDEIEAFICPNPEFRPAGNRKPVILIGAGTGIDPLAGFARANRRRRPMHLYFGIRHPDSDFRCGREIADWQGQGRLGRGRRKPRSGARRALSVLELQDAAVATSGDCRQWVRVGGARLSHGMGRKRGGPARHRPRTVLAPDCMTADALARAILVLGWQEGIALAERFGVGCLLLERDADGNTGEGVSRTGSVPEASFP